MRLKFFILFLLIGCVFSFAQEKKQVCILYFNDLHGHLQPYQKDFKNPQMVGGVAKFKKVLDQIRKENNAKKIPTFLVFAGDLLQGTIMSTIFQGEPDIQVLNLMKVDVACPGNHEFDYGFANMEKICKQESMFPWVCANIYQENKVPGTPHIIYDRLLPSFLILQKENVRLGVIGTITPDTKWTTHPKNVENLLFSDPVKEVAGIAEQLKEQVDMVIVVSHSGREFDKQMAKIPGISVVIGGHNQVLIDPPDLIGATPVCQAGDHGDYLGRVDFSIQDRKITYQHHQFYPITQDLPEDERIAKLVESYASKLSSKLSQVVGNAKVPLNGIRSEIRWGETNLGNLITDSMRSITRAEIALINSGGIRASIPEGPITIEQVYQVLPFSNTLVTAYYSGTQIMEMLNRSASLPKEADSGAFLQVSGISYEIVEGKAQQVKVGNTPLQLDRKYKIALTDFMAVGGDGYIWCKDGEKLENTGYPFNSLMIQYLQEIKEVAPQVEGRILRK